MSKKENLMIYPFDSQSSPLLRYCNLLDQYSITAVVSPNGWGMSGKDVGIADGGSNIGITIDRDFDGKLGLCDTVLFTEASALLDFKIFIYPKIQKAIAAGKNIICLMDIENATVEQLREVCDNKGVYFKKFSPTEDLNPYNEKNVKDTQLLKINVPVIFVLGMAERTQKFEIQLSLRENLINAGYRVSQVGTRHYCEMFGFHSFPKFMYSCSITESDKIIMFNHFIKHIELTEKPDVVIVGIPGGVIPFNNKFTNNFGILAYEISNAVTPDASILSVLYDDYKEEHFERLSTSIRYKLGLDVDCFNLSNIKFDWNASNIENKMIHLTVSTNFVDEKKRSFGGLSTPIYNILNTADAVAMSNYLVDRLGEYANVECL
ncbi:MAG: TIGR04066 family peptide maturation system protein [Clostridia bacterium]|nr:TIGR04066 family peptide maturation system protein [Clostridia bacterium]